MAAIRPTGSDERAVAAEGNDENALNVVSGDEDEDAADVEEEGDKKKKGIRKRRSAAELNLLRDPTDIVVELTESVLQELAGAKKLHQLRYPTYIVCTNANFQLRALDGLRAIKGTALKELDLSFNKLMVLDGLEQFSTLKTLKVRNNHITEVTIEKLPRLRYLDLSHNKLDGIPDLSGFKALAYLNLSHNYIGTRPDSETSRDGWENFKNSSLQQLSTFDLSHNQLNWDQKTFNEQVASLKEKRIKHLSFDENPFKEEVEAYRIWIISNTNKLVDLDGEKVAAPARPGPAAPARLAHDGPAPLPPRPLAPPLAPFTPLAVLASAGVAAREALAHQGPTRGGQGGEARRLEGGLFRKEGDGQALRADERADGLLRRARQDAHRGRARAGPAAQTDPDRLAWKDHVRLRDRGHER